MPTYRYRCGACGEEFEVWQSITDTSIATHRDWGGEEACGGQLVKVLSPAGIVLKGSGFYKTDSRSNGGRNGGTHKDSRDSSDKRDAREKRDSREKKDSESGSGSGAGARKDKKDKESTSSSSSTNSSDTSSTSDRGSPKHTPDSSSSTSDSSKSRASGSKT